MTNIPTDAELIAFAVETGMRVRTGKGVVSFARAVLARWGQPAHSGEPVALTLANHEAGEIGYCQFTSPVPFETPLYAAHQPVAREPLPSVEIMHIVMGVEQQHNFLRGTTNWAAAVGRAIEAAHGIKGGQHGTDI